MQLDMKRIIRKAINRMGLDVVKHKNSPKRTLLGLAAHDIGTVIDVGANQGQFARSIINVYPQAEIHCFEPLDTPYRALSEWAEAQNGRVHCYQMALGDKEGEENIHLHEEHTPSSSLLSATDTCHRLYPQTIAKSEQRINVSTLDSIFLGMLEKMPRDIFLKLDVQGFEDRVLRGGKRFLPQCHAVLLEVCLDSLYEGQADFLELTQLLYGSGFRYAGNLDQAYGDNGRVVFLDALFIR